MNQTLQIINVRFDRRPLIRAIEAAGATVDDAGQLDRCPLCGAEHFASIGQRTTGEWFFRCNAPDCAVELDVISFTSRVRSMSRLGLLEPVEVSR